MSEPEKKEGEAPATSTEVKSGTVLQCGATDWWAIGRTKEVRHDYQNLPVPTRLKALEVRTAPRP
jgi:hypothetical protein